MSLQRVRHGVHVFYGVGSNVQVAWPMFTMQNTMQMLINDRSMCMVATLSIDLSNNPSLYNYQIYLPLSYRTTHRDKIPLPSPPTTLPYRILPNYNPHTTPRALPRGVRPPLPPLPYPSPHRPYDPCPLPLTHLYIYPSPPTPAQRPDPLRSATCYLLPACLKPEA